MANGTIRRLISALLGLATVAAPFAVLLTFMAPAGAQFFDGRFPFLQDRFWRPRPPTYHPDAQRGPPPDNSKAPPAKKAEVEPLTSVLVVGDSLADWLAHGLETAFSDSPEMGVVRKHRTGSGLVRNDTRSDHPDWPQTIRELLAAEKADIVVMMIGLHDRQQIRERAPARGTAQQQVNQPAAPQGQHNQPAQQAAPPQNRPNSDEPIDADSPSIAPDQPQPRPGSTIGTHEFRSEKWVELYSKRIDDTIAAMKSKGSPVFWVGLPSIRGSRASSEVMFLNDLFRARADRNGIVYVDVWDGFADESGRFATQGPDFEGQIRRLRSADGVHFTQAGARKLAHYVEREIRRVLNARNTPIAIPVQPEPVQQAPAARPGMPMARPLSGPVMPLTAAVGASEDLLGAGGVHQSTTDPVATRVLVKGEAMPAPAGRADDFAWPRRGVAPVGSDPIAATTTLPMTPMVAQPPQQPQQAPPPGTGQQTATRSEPRSQSQAARSPAGQPGYHGFFFGGPRGGPRPPGGMGQADARNPPPRQSPFFLLFPPIR